MSSFTDTWTRYLHGVPDLTGAACKGNPPTWWDMAGSRTLLSHHHIALQLCNQCPVRQACAQQPGIERADIILAGTAYTATGKPINTRRAA